MVSLYRMFYFSEYVQIPISLEVSINETFVANLSNSTSNMYSEYAAAFQRAVSLQ